MFRFLEPLEPRRLLSTAGQLDPSFGNNGTLIDAAVDATASRMVIASDGKINLTGDNKLHRLRSSLSEPFSYIGNATPDLPLLAESVEPMVANPSTVLRAKMRARGLQPVRAFDEREKNHFIRVEPSEWQLAREQLEENGQSTSEKSA